MRPSCFRSHRADRAAGNAMRQVRPTSLRLWGQRLVKKVSGFSFFWRMMVGISAAAIRRVGPANWAMEAGRIWFRYFIARMTVVVTRSISAVKVSGLAVIPVVRFVRILWIG